MNNGGRKGGSPDAFRVLHTAPGLEDIWQLHWSATAGMEHNAPGVFIANVEDNAALAAILTAPPPDPAAARGAGGARGAGAGRGAGGGRGGGAQAHTPAYWIKVSANQDGSFIITNARNGFSKTYPARN
jgi:hypothetical protein